MRDAAGKDFYGVLKRIAEMGYAGVEMGGMEGRNVGEVATFLKDHGLRSPSGFAPLPAPDNIHTTAEIAAALGYKRIVCGFGPDDMKTEDGAKRCTEKLAKACDVARSVGLTLAIHNHWWEFDHQFGGRTPFEIMMSGAPLLTSELDIYWSSRGGADTPAVVKKWSKRIPLLHVKDGDLGPESVHTAVGDGKVPVRAAIEAADATLEWLIVELDACKTDMFDAVAKSLGWLKGAGLGIGRQ